MGATLGLIAGGILKGWGDARQQEAADARALAIEDLRERRRQAEIQQKRVWEVEDRNYSETQDDKRAVAAAAHQDSRDEFALKRDDARFAQQDKLATARDASMERRISARDGEGREPAEVKTATWLADIQTKAEAGDKSAKRTLEAYGRITQSKSDSPAENARNYAKMVVETTKGLIDDPEYSGKTYAERTAAARGIVDDLLAAGGNAAAPTAVPAATAQSPAAPAPSRGLMGDGAAPPAVRAPSMWDRKPPTAAPGTQANPASTEPSGPRVPPPAAIDALRKNPDRAGEFDTKFGVGASKQYLGQ